MSIPFYDRTLSGLSRRQLLNAAWKLGAAAVLQPVVSSRVFAQPVFGSYPFTLGVASGDPWPDSVVLWTRVNRLQNLSVTAQVSTAPDFSGTPLTFAEK